MVQAVLRISIGALAVSLTSACSSLPPRASPTPQGLSGNQTDERVSVSATMGTQSDPETARTVALTQAVDADRSQADTDTAMRKRGYTPVNYRGERVYCRKQAITGSNLESNLCLTARQIEDQARATKDIINGYRPAGCPPKTGNTGCN